MGLLREEKKEGVKNNTAYVHCWKKPVGTVNEQMATASVWKHLFDLFGDQQRGERRTHSFQTG